MLSGSRLIGRLGQLPSAWLMLFADCQSGWGQGVWLWWWGVSVCVLLSRLKQHDHPLSFLSQSIYRHALHPMKLQEELYLKDDNPRKDSAMLRWVNSDLCCIPFSASDTCKVVQLWRFMLMLCCIKKKKAFSQFIFSLFFWLYTIISR